MSNYRRRLLLANQSEENLILYGNSVQDGTPTPEAPIDIMSVENPIIKITGKNLFNKEAVEKLSMYIGTDNWWVSSDSSSFRIKCEPNKSYVISGENPSCTIFRAGYIITDDLPTEGLGIKLYNIKRYSSFNQPITITTGEEAKYLVVQVNSGSWEQNIEKLQIEEGLNVTEYEPYEEELITIDETTPFGKNLIPTYTGTDYQSSLYTCIHNGDGTFVINGSGNGSSYATCCILAGRLLNNLLVNGETYTFSLNCSDTTTTSACLVIRYREISTGTDRWYSNSLSKCTRFTVNKDVYDYQQLYIQINPNTQTFTNVIVKPMLARGSYTELPFEPYISPITTMRGIGNYKDRIYTKDGKVWFEQNVKSISLADENYNTYGSGLNMVYTKNNIDIPISYYTEGMCNLYKVSQPPTGVENILDNTVVIDRNDKKIYIRDLVNATTSTVFNSWIKTVESELIHPLANPIITEITGALAEKILAIDKSKNICFISENGIQGETEVIEE